jgi:hypothetical protein
MKGQEKGGIALPIIIVIISSLIPKESNFYHNTNQNYNKEKRTANGEG